jgi:branched-chain amino acid transport system permease protein
MAKTVIEIVIAGLLTGGIYALIAMGLSLQYGVVRVLNISHGEFIMIGAFLTWVLYTATGINPLISLVIVSPFIFGIGLLLNRTLFTRLRNSAPSPGAFEGISMLATFGLMFVIQNIALQLWGGGLKQYSFLAVGLEFGGTVIPENRLIALLFALVAGIIFYVFLARTRQGKAIRAAAQDAVTARLMGVNINHVLTICFGLGALMAAFAGVLISMCYPINASMGMEYTTIAIIVIVLGGLGSIPGSFIGGFLLGIIGAIVAYKQPGLTMASYYVIFMLLLLMRPKGILGK